MIIAQEDPLPCNSGILGINEDPNIVLIIPDSHYDRVGGPPKLLLLISGPRDPSSGQRGSGARRKPRMSCWISPSASVRGKCLHSPPSLHFRCCAPSGFHSSSPNLKPHTVSLLGPWPNFSCRLLWQKPG